VGIPASPAGTKIFKPLVSPTKTSKRKSRLVSEEAVFLSEASDLATVTSIEESVGKRLSQQCQKSLSATMDDLHLDASTEPAERSRVAKKTWTDLSQFVEAANKDKEQGDHRHTSPNSDSDDMLVSQSSDVPDGMEALESLARYKVGKRASAFLCRIGLRPEEAGSRNRTRWRRKVLWNQCFYLSIAQAYLGPKASQRKTCELALRLGYAIEATVLEKNPSWAADLKASADGTGDAMVFADFLPVAMNVETAEPNFLAQLAVCVLDSVNGHVEVYIGPEYSALSEADQAENLVLLWYSPWHYQYLVRDDEEGSKAGMTYDVFKQLLVRHGVMFIETLE